MKSATSTDSTEEPMKADTLTPRTDHYRAEFKRNKEPLTELTSWLLDEFAQEELALYAAQNDRDRFEESNRQAQEEIARLREQLSHRAPTTASAKLVAEGSEFRGRLHCLKPPPPSSSFDLWARDNWQAIATALSAIAPKSCAWHLDGEDSETYATACGQYYCYSGGTLEECEARYCQGCGGKISVTTDEGTKG